MAREVGIVSRYHMGDVYSPNMSCNLLLSRRYIYTGNISFHRDWNSSPDPYAAPPNNYYVESLAETFSISFFHARQPSWGLTCLSGINKRFGGRKDG
jgi:hypothetical protein